jgi:hypothetical protein
MDRISRFGLFVVLGLGLSLGCGKSPPTESAATTGATAPQAAAHQADVSQEPAALATADFLDAVFKGDSQRASARLTPQAIDRIVASGKQFSPPGWQTAKFQITQVRTPSQDQAVVLCAVTDTAAIAEGPALKQEYCCCLLRLVERDWRVCGMAYGMGDNKPWTLNDYETGRTVPISMPNMAGPASNPEGSGTGRPSPRTAQEPASPGVR